MKSLLWLTLMLVGAGVATQPLPGAPNSTSERPNGLVGAWKLVSLQEPSADGQVHRVECAGMFTFTESGKASVQVMYPTAQTASAYAKAGYEASFGSYHIDSSSTFTFHIEGALVRTLIGEDLKRSYEISNNRLIVKSTNPNEHWKVVWERY